MLPVLREARSAIASIRCEGTALYVRNEIFSELERTISDLDEQAGRGSGTFLTAKF